ncbi:amidohydrolase, partial [Candidatus Bathyarchaeota archaeon]
MKKSVPDDLCADLALINGMVLTVDAHDSVAEAVATKGSRILRVGSNEEIIQVVGEETEVVDLGGKTVLPGLIDSHMHPGSYGVFWVRGVRCGPDIESMEELLSRIREKADASPEGSWILGYSLDDVRLGRYPTRRELDEAAPRNPLYIQRRDGHIGVANSMALRLAGIDRDTPDPPHGKIDRDEDREPTGVLRESAKDLVYGIIPPYTVEEYKRGLKHVFEEFISLGLTTVHASMVSPDEFRALQELRREGSLRLRICVHASGREEGVLE